MSHLDYILSEIDHAVKFGGVPAKFNKFGEVPIGTFTARVLVSYSGILPKETIAFLVQQGLNARNWVIFSTNLSDSTGFRTLRIDGNIYHHNAPIVISGLLKEDITSLNLVTVLNNPEVTTSGVTASASTPTATGVANGVYTAQSGDTLSKIAAKFNTTVAALAALNGITNINQISVGQKLKVSGKATTAPIDTITDIIATGGTAPSNNAGVPPPAPTGQNWFDKTFFTGAGTLSAAGIAVLVVGAAVVVMKSRDK